jgi:hypothetical protein
VFRRIQRNETPNKKNLVVNENFIYLPTFSLDFDGQMVAKFPGKQKAYPIPKLLTSRDFLFQSITRVRFIQN